jgi:hypothetical protein
MKLGRTFLPEPDVHGRTRTQHALLAADAHPRVSDDTSAHTARRRKDARQQGQGDAHETLDGELVAVWSRPYVRLLPSR